MPKKREEEDSGDEQEDDDEEQEDDSGSEEGSGSDDDEPVKKKKKPAKKAGKKRKRDGVKGAASAFNLFSKDRRSELKAQGSTASFGDLSKQVGAEWKTLDPAAKKKYEEMAKKDKSRYEQEKKAAGSDEDGSDDDEDTKPKKKKAKKDPNAPKRNTNSYMHFTKTARLQLLKDRPELAKQQKEITKILGEKWRGMADDDKKPFEEMAKQDKVRYEHAMAAYKKGK